MLIYYPCTRLVCLRMSVHNASSTPLVRLNGCGLYAGDRWLVRNLNLQVRSGEIVTLIGPNGSGKTTTARLVVGVAQLSNGNRVAREGLRIGYMPQRMPLDWTLPLSVKRLMRLTNSLSEEEIQNALAATGVAHLLHAQVRRLSGGELQRVLLARVMARKPQLLVLDEPVQGVDLGGEIALYELIARIRDVSGCGILLVSHDLHIVMAATDHVVCINGHICCEGPPSSVVNHAAYQQLFDARAAGLALYQHHHNHTHLPDGRVREEGDEC